MFYTHKKKKQQLTRQFFVGIKFFFGRFFLDIGTKQQI